MADGLDPKGKAGKPPKEKKAKKKGGKKRKIVFLVVLVLLFGGGFGGYKVAFAGEANGAETTTTTAPPSRVRLSDITMNLTDGHVLKVGITLVVVAEPHSPELHELMAGGEGGSHGGGSSSGTAGVVQESPLSGHEAVALNETIMILGDKTKDELEAPGGRAKARDELTDAISHAYHGDVINVLFTNFVMS